MPERLSLLFCCSPGFFQHVAVASVSALENTPDCAIDIHLIANGADPAAEDRLRQSLRPYPAAALTIHRYTTSHLRHFFVAGHITLDTYVRLFACEILPASVRRVIYLDADLVVVDDLRPLWNMEMDGHALAAAPDLQSRARLAVLGMPPDATYVNAGVLLLDLAQWRTRGLVGQLQAFIERDPAALLYHDQDALNAVLHRQTHILGQRWNVQTAMYRAGRRAFPDRFEERRAACRDPAIIHYAGSDKPWKFRAETACKDVYFRYLAKTAWRQARPPTSHAGQALEFRLGRCLDRTGLDYVHVLQRLRRAPRRLRELTGSTAR